MSGEWVAAVGSNGVPSAELVITMLVLTTLIGIGVRRFANLPPGTALLGALPGGAGEMIAMSDSLGADVRLVTVMQYGRLLAILATISVVGHFAGAQAGSGQHASHLAPLFRTEPLNYLVSTIIAITGALMGVRFRIPAGTMLVPAILAALAGIVGMPAAPWPPFIMASGYLVLCLQIGGNVDAAVLAPIRP